MDDCVEGNKRRRIHSEREECGTVAALDCMSFEDGGSADSSLEPRLSAEQAMMLEEVRKGKNVLVTGCAGTGKRYLRKTLRQELFDKHGRGRVFVTASTASAALPLHGTTMHSFAGFLPSDDDILKEDLVIKLKRKDKKAVRSR